MIKLIHFCILLLITPICLIAIEAGDPEAVLDESKLDPNYPQMTEWAKAGVTGGIPPLDSLEFKTTINPTNSDGIANAIDKVAAAGGGAILLKNGVYRINKQVDMRSDVSLVGESKYGVVCLIDKNIDENNKGRNTNIPGASDDGNAAFKFGTGVEYSGLYRITIEGGWGKPKYDWNISDKKKNFELPHSENISVWFIGASNCWIDDLVILNSADFPVRCIGKHITMRNLHVDGVFNKCGGCHGYFMLLGDSTHNLITGCYITRLRHISLQDEGVRYNVLYNNTFEQEVSFHSHDGGDNLIENNHIILPVDMPNAAPNYFSIMGPWASFHKISIRPNYIFKNTIIEKNHNYSTPWSDQNVVYEGPYYVKPENPLINFKPNSKGAPTGGTLFPVRLIKETNETMVK